MTLLGKYGGLFTDHYELTMAQAYFFNGHQNKSSCFDYFFRKAPFNGAYVVFAGLYELLETLVEFKFSNEDLEYLSSIGFKKEFIIYLSNFSFKGTIHSVREGEIVFPNEPILRVEGNIIEAQLLETLVLNILNFESLIATKASRLRQVAGDKILIDFGIRRAQGLGGIQASKAAIIGGVDRTSNEYSAFLFDLLSSGTQAHSFIQSYDRQIDAFREFANVFPYECVLLVDTYDTLGKGIPDAIQVAKELELKGYKLKGVRLDSGDLAFLSKETRKMLDGAGLNYVKIIASNQLDEESIRELLEVQAPIDIFGIGTSLITGQKDAAMDGVYKLCMANNTPRLKLSEEKEKIILPGIKKVYRFLDNNGMFEADGILLEEENSIGELFTRVEPNKILKISTGLFELITNKVIDNGKILINYKTPYEIKSFVQNRLKQLDGNVKNTENPDMYKVGISKKLSELQLSTIESIK